MYKFNVVKFPDEECAVIEFVNEHVGCSRRGDITRFLRKEQFGTLWRLFIQQDWHIFYFERIEDMAWKKSYTLMLNAINLNLMMWRRYIYSQQPYIYTYYLGDERGVRMKAYRDTFLPAPAIEINWSRIKVPISIPDSKGHGQRHLQKTYSQPTKSIQST